MDEEFVIEMEDKQIRCPAFPQDCEYVRVTDKEGNEVAYWHYNEWEEEPQSVMGAFLATIGNDLMKIELLLNSEPNLPEDDPRENR